VKFRKICREPHVKFRLDFQEIPAEMAKRKNLARTLSRGLDTVSAVTPAVALTEHRGRGRPVKMLASEIMGRADNYRQVFWHYRLHSNKKHPSRNKWVRDKPHPWANPQSLNGYAYVWNNTENQIDPTGLRTYACLARIRRQDVGGCDYGSIDESAFGGGDEGGLFDEEVLLGNAGPGFGDLHGYTVFDAVAGAPGTYFNLEPTGQVSWGFSITTWYSAMAAQDAQLLANSREGYFRQLGAAVAALQAALQAAGVQPGRIQDLISAFIQENSSFNPATVQLGGGNFDFQAQSLGAFLNCVNERCDEGGLGTIDYSHNDGTLHLDTADPFNFPGGTFLHTAVDVLLGNLFYFVIPR
jgi:hypothetical protein